jgi:hypothetical protein
MLAGTVFCSNVLAMTSMTIPQNPQDRNTVDVAQESASASASAQVQTQLDRGGVDRASVHLQILQQSNTHFSDNNVAKKPVLTIKKHRLKHPVIPEQALIS